MGLIQKIIHMRWVNLLICICFTITSTPVIQAAVLPYMPEPSERISASLSYDLPLLKGIVFSEDSPFYFTFLIKRGNIEREETIIRSEVNKISKYFLAALTLPGDDLWVNLSPYEQDRISTDNLALTDLGKDMLGEDYILKQFVASITYPEEGPGKEFWDKVYRELQKKFGTSNVPVSTFNKVWIMPDKIKVIESRDRAVIESARLKVMMDDDYLAISKNKSMGSDSANDRRVKDVSNQVMRETILPLIEKEVNEGKYFAHLRQIYHAIVMANWYKEKLKNTILNSVYFDKSKLKGADTNDPQVREKIYNTYTKAFREGVYNYIKTDQDPGNRFKKIRRKYISGGATLTTGPNGTVTLATTVVEGSEAQVVAAARVAMPGDQVIRALVNEMPVDRGGNVLAGPDQQGAQWDIDNDGAPRIAGGKGGKGKGGKGKNGNDSADEVAVGGKPFTAEEASRAEEALKGLFAEYGVEGKVTAEDVQSMEKAHMLGKGTLTARPANGKTYTREESTYTEAEKKAKIRTFAQYLRDERRVEFSKALKIAGALLERGILGNKLGAGVLFDLSSRSNNDAKMFPASFQAALAGQIAGQMGGVASGAGGSASGVEGTIISLAAQSLGISQQQLTASQRAAILKVMSKGVRGVPGVRYGSADRGELTRDGLFTGEQADQMLGLGAYSPVGEQSAYLRDELLRQEGLQISTADAARISEIVRVNLGNMMPSEELKAIYQNNINQIDGKWHFSLPTPAGRTVLSQAYDAREEAVAALYNSAVAAKFTNDQVGRVRILRAALGLNYVFDRALGRYIRRDTPLVTLTLNNASAINKAHEIKNDIPQGFDTNSMRLQPDGTYVDKSGNRYDPGNIGKPNLNGQYLHGTYNKRTVAAKRVVLMNGKIDIYKVNTQGQRVQKSADEILAQALGIDVSHLSDGAVYAAAMDFMAPEEGGITSVGATAIMRSGAAGDEAPAIQPSDTARSNRASAAAANARSPIKSESLLVNYLRQFEVKGNSTAYHAFLDQFHAAQAGKGEYPTAESIKAAADHYGNLEGVEKYLTAVLSGVAGDNRQVLKSLAANVVKQHEAGRNVLVSNLVDVLGAYAHEQSSDIAAVLGLRHIQVDDIFAAMTVADKAQNRALAEKVLGFKISPELADAIYSAHKYGVAYWRPDINNGRGAMAFSAEDRDEKKSMVRAAMKKQYSEFDLPAYERDKEAELAIVKLMKAAVIGEGVNPADSDSSQAYVVGQVKTLLGLLAEASRMPNVTADEQEKQSTALWVIMSQVAGLLSLDGRDRDGDDKYLAFARAAAAVEGNRDAQILAKAVDALDVRQAQRRVVAEIDDKIKAFAAGGQSESGVTRILARMELISNPEKKAQKVAELQAVTRDKALVGRIGELAAIRSDAGQGGAAGLSAEVLATIKNGFDQGTPIGMKTDAGIVLITYTAGADGRIAVRVGNNGQGRMLVQPGGGDALTLQDLSGFYGAMLQRTKGINGSKELEAAVRGMFNGAGDSGYDFVRTAAQAVSATQGDSDTKGGLDFAKADAEVALKDGGLIFSTNKSMAYLEGGKVAGFQLATLKLTY